MAANMLAPYLHSKVARPRSKFIEPEAELTLPPLDSLEHAVKSIAQIKTALVEGTLSTDDAQQLIAVDQAYIAGKSAVELVDLQQRLDAIEATISTQPTTPTFRVQGGLPPLPGTNIIMQSEPVPRRINGGHAPPMIDAPAQEPVQERE
jgi:hypothetical protein